MSDRSRARSARQGSDGDPILLPSWWDDEPTDTELAAIEAAGPVDDLADPAAVRLAADSLADLLARWPWPHTVRYPSARHHGGYSDLGVAA